MARAALNLDGSRWIALCFTWVVAMGSANVEGHETNCWEIAYRVLEMTERQERRSASLFEPRTLEPLASVGMAPRRIVALERIRTHAGTEADILRCRAIATLDNWVQLYVSYWSYRDAKRSRGFLFVE